MKTTFFYLTIFITGAAVLVIEILGTRILAPFYGSTIFVWSSLISVTLAFLALGYLWGGKLADRKPDTGLLYWIVFAAGISIVLIPKYSNWVLIQTDRFGLKFGPLIAAFIIFFAPLFLLGAVSPFAVKIRTRLLDHLGITAGSLYATATLGSLAGALFAGFLLIPNFSVSWIINATGVILISLFFIWQILALKKTK